MTDVSPTVAIWRMSHLARHQYFSASALKHLWDPLTEVHIPDSVEEFCDRCSANFEHLHSITFYRLRAGCTSESNRYIVLQHYREYEYPSHQINKMHPCRSASRMTTYQMQRVELQACTTGRFLSSNVLRVINCFECIEKSTRHSKSDGR